MAVAKEDTRSEKKVARTQNDKKFRVLFLFICVVIAIILVATTNKQLVLTGGQPQAKPDVQQVWVRTPKLPGFKGVNVYYQGWDLRSATLHRLPDGKIHVVEDDDHDTYTIDTVNRVDGTWKNYDQSSGGRLEYNFESEDRIVGIAWLGSEPATSFIVYFKKPPR